MTLVIGQSSRLLAYDLNILVAHLCIMLFDEESRTGAGACHHAGARRNQESDEVSDIVGNQETPERLLRAYPLSPVGRKSMAFGLDAMFGRNAHFYRYVVRPGVDAKPSNVLSGSGIMSCIFG